MIKLKAVLKSCSRRRERSTFVVATKLDRSRPREHKPRRGPEMGLNQEAIKAALHVLAAVSVMLVCGCRTHIALRETAQEADFYVSTLGDDAWSGRSSLPNSMGTDGPFATLGRARDAARAARSAGHGPGIPIRVVVREGVYRLSESLLLNSSDSSLHIEGAVGEDVVISGGCRATSWSHWKGDILKCDISGLGLSDTAFRELYYNGALMQWARTPNLDPKHPRTGGFLQNENIVEADTKTKFRYRDGELRPETWAHPEGAWIQFHDSLNYETQYCPVKSIDADQRIVEAVKGVYKLSRGNPFYLCGILEELDAPGEWCVAPDGKTLYFYPPSGNPNAKDEVIIPNAASAFVLKGEPEQGRWVQGVRLTNLAIRDFRGRAIELFGARDCAVTACDLRNAEVGVYLGDDTHACRVAGCDITQTQGDGVSILGTSKDHERVTDHVVDNCYIWNIGWGRIHNRCGGVYMHRCARVKLTHNHVHDTPRYALAMDVGNDCEFAYNYCHHSNLVTADTSIIEAATALDWGLPIDKQRERHRPHNWGNTVHHNLLHDSGGWGTDRATGQLTQPYYSWGIYLDVDCCGWNIHHNVCYNTVKGGFMLNAGTDNVVEDNIFVDGQHQQIQWNPWRGYTMRDNRCVRNVFAYGKGADLYALSRFEDGFVHFEDNVIWAAGSAPVIRGVPKLPRNGSWEGWLDRGQDRGSTVTDPLFVNRRRHDYRLRQNSPASGAGLTTTDLSHVGNYASAERRTWPRPEERVVRDVADYTPNSHVPTQPECRTYEEYVVGEPERNAHVGNDGAGTALVTDETAADGTNSLKFTDAAGLKASFFPYVTYPLVLESGLLRMRFDLRWEQGALLALDWRDDPYDFNMGPNLITTADGWLSANGKRLLQLPAGQWLQVDIRCKLGPKADGTYELTLTLPGGEKRVFKELVCSADFRFLNCIVFMTVGDAPGVFYIDNLEFTPSRWH